MKELYPELQPFETGMLPVSELHTIYYERCGNPDGLPIVFLHGGPGGGITESYRRFFDPAAYNIVLFDQRGSGKSTPHAELEGNTTWDIVADIERLREKFGIEKWIVFGGSWGSTLALTYAETHPMRVSGLILRGIFLCRPSELSWFYQQGASQIFPDFWEPYRDAIPENERGDMMQAYYKRMTSDDEKTRLDACRAWSVWEGSTSKLYPDTALIDHFAGDKESLALARIECHYFVNNCFFPTDNYLLENIEKIRHIPTVIVQGRYDVVCPATSAWNLHKAFPESSLTIVPAAGHSVSEPGITSALVEATDKIRDFNRELKGT
ncbi:MAG: prolyl aminopeptidase [Pyrinomonadaceae bacterium]